MLSKKQIMENLRTYTPKSKSEKTICMCVLAQVVMKIQDLLLTDKDINTQSVMECLDELKIKYGIK